VHKIRRPSRFAVLSLLVLFFIAVVAILMIAHIDLKRYRTVIPGPAYFLDYESSENASSRWWPTIPPGFEKREAPTGWIYLYYGFAFRGYIITLEGDMRGFEDVTQLQSFRYGWPMTTQSTKVVVSYGLSERKTLWPEGADSVSGNVPITYHPIGLLINALLYAIPLWVVLMLIRSLVLVIRNRRRVRRGECVCCGYTLDGLAMCPECGSEPAGA